MLLLTILLLILAIFMGIIATVAMIGGAGFIIVFGDIVVCVIVIGFIVKLIKKLKNKEQK